MRQTLTSDQFVAGVIATLALQDRRHFVLAETELDECFQKAFEALLANEDELGVAPNFTFFVDPMHGDSVCLRDTLLAAKEKELIALNNPTFHTFDIKLNTERAKQYLSRNPLPPAFFSDIVERYFAKLG